MLEELINLANHLDKEGLSKEADRLDKIISKSAAQEFSDDEDLVTQGPGGQAARLGGSGGITNVNQNMVGGGYGAPYTTEGGDEPEGGEGSGGADKPARRGRGGPGGGTNVNQNIVFEPYIDSDKKVAYVMVDIGFDPNYEDEGSLHVIPYGPGALEDDALVYDNIRFREGESLQDIAARFNQRSEQEVVGPGGTPQEGRDRGGDDEGEIKGGTKGEDPSANKDKGTLLDYSLEGMLADRFITERELGLFKSMNEEHLAQQSWFDRQFKPKPLPDERNIVNYGSQLKLGNITMDEFNSHKQRILALWKPVATEGGADTASDQAPQGPEGATTRVYNEGEEPDSGAAEEEEEAQEKSGFGQLWPD